MTSSPTSPIQPVISGYALTKTFGKGEAQVTAIDGIDIQIPASQWTTLMGPSGSGKTTLLHCLAGLDTPTSGRVVLHGTTGRSSAIVLSDLSSGARAKLRRTRIGVIFQEFNLVPVLNAGDNIALPAKLAHARIDQQWRDDIVERLGLGGRLKHLPHQLSGGQRQRVAIARALLTRPDIIFADEPTGNLDSTSGAAVLELFRQIVNEFGQTLTVITHDPVCAQMGDHIVTIKDGRTC